jgi:tetratricopeptide (TPR) repeat protein
MEICARVLLDEPDNPGALYVTGSVLLAATRYVQVIQTAKRIIEVCPKDPRGYGLLAVCYGQLHKYELSIQNAERAVSLSRTAKTLSDACYAHTNAGNWDIASKYGESALAMGDDSPLAKEALLNARVSMGYVRLAQGKWVDGFQGFRNTMRTKWRKERVYDTPNGPTVEWQGEKDAVVVVTGEQGLGDEIMAAGMIPDAAANCRKFVFDCDERLGPLFKRSFPDIVVSPTRRADALATPVMPTHHKTLFGLAELFRQTDESFPRQSYLRADPNLRAMFSALLDSWAEGTTAWSKPLIGLAWSGGLPRTGMEQRKAGLNAFLPLIRKGDAEFVSLEYKDDAAEVAAFETQHGLKVRRIPWATQSGNMELLAALIAECSEVIGVATTALHLSSALGVPTTIIVNRGLGWQFAGDELLWYPPTTRLWRKQSGASWRDSVAALVETRKR